MPTNDLVIVSMQIWFESAHYFKRYIVHKKVSHKPDANADGIHTKNNMSPSHSVEGHNDRVVFNIELTKKSMLIIRISLEEKQQYFLIRAS